MFAAPTRRLNLISRSLRQVTSPIRNMSDEQRPTGLIANKGIELLTFGTPNGHKASIMLEELKAAYGKEYTTQAIVWPARATLRLLDKQADSLLEHLRERSERALVHQDLPEWSHPSYRRS